jgi:hypothetical protein
MDSVVAAGLNTRGLVSLVEGATAGRATGVDDDATMGARSALDDLGDRFGVVRDSRADRVGGIVADDGLLATHAQAFFDGEKQAAGCSELTGDADQQLAVTVPGDGRVCFAILAEDITGDVDGILVAALTEGPASPERL